MTKVKESLNTKQQLLKEFEEKGEKAFRPLNTHPLFVNLQGQTFGRAKVIGYAGRDTRRINCWFIKCDCGKINVTRSINLTAGITTNCGNHKFDNYHRLGGTRINKIWEDIKQRCLNPNCKNYHRYGGRGITICSEWTNSFISFYNWAIKNGYDDSLTIDRRNNNKGYSPENCRWVDKSTQLANRNKLNKNKSGYIGVKKVGEKWLSEVRFKGEYKYFGLFKVAKEAAKVRDTYVIEKGWPHTLNFPTKKS